MATVTATTAPATRKTGRFAILEQFLADGMRCMFGNPGTVEQGFLDALGDYPDLRYMLTLQESVAVMMADGYARATQKPTLVQLHSSPGVGNAIGALYQAYRGHSPLVVIGGDAGVKYQAMDSQMAGDLVAMAEPVTKWSTMVVDPASMLRVLRRAIKIAATPPMGPVYVCLPQDMLDAPAVEPVRPTSIPVDARRARRCCRCVRRRECSPERARPMIFIGDGVAYLRRAGGARARRRAAWRRGVGGRRGEAEHAATTHPLYQGMTGHMFGAQQPADHVQRAT